MTIYGNNNNKKYDNMQKEIRYFYNIYSLWFVSLAAGGRNKSG